MSTSSIKRQIRRFQVVVVHWTSKKCTKKRDARAEQLFWSFNLLFSEFGVFVLVVVVETLSKNDDDGIENVDKKMNLRSFKLNRVYLDPLKMSSADDFSWSWILKDFIQVQKGEGKFVVVFPRQSSIKRQIRRFHVVVVHCGRPRNVLKSMMHV